jgi:hypothetical protein
MPRPKRVIKGTVPKRERYRSGFEVKVKKSLESRGIEFKYESEKLPYIVPESKHLYTPDFIVQTGVGTTIYVEAKGNFTAADRKKMKLVIEQNPDKDIRMLFMRNNKIQRNSKTTYGSWCDKHGIKWAVSSLGHVPETWVKGEE